jgi:hypothetical protein
MKKPITNHSFSSPIPSKKPIEKTSRIIERRGDIINLYLLPSIRF